MQNEQSDKVEIWIQLVKLGWSVDYRVLAWVRQHKLCYQSTITTITWPSPWILQAFPLRFHLYLGWLFNRSVLSSMEEVLVFYLKQVRKNVFSMINESHYNKDNARIQHCMACSLYPTNSDVLCPYTLVGLSQIWSKICPECFQEFPNNFTYYASQCSYYACIMLLSCQQFLVMSWKI